MLDLFAVPDVPMFGVKPLSLLLDGHGTIPSRGKPKRQKRGKCMSRRTGQNGTVVAVGKKWIGRYFEDTAEGRKRVAIALGLRNEMTKSQARLKLRKIVEDAGVNEPEHVERAAGRLWTFGAAALEWEAKRLPQLKLSSQYAYPRLINKHIVPAFGQVALADLRTGLINDWIGKLTAGGLEPKTIHNLWKMLRSIVNWEAKQRDEQPRRFYPSLPVIPVREPRWFTPDEASKIIGEAQGQFRVMFRLAWASGLRCGELLSLHVEDIDLGRGIVHVRRSLYRNIETTPKTPRSFRDVWIDSGTVKMLAEYLEGRQSGLVFETKTGTPLEARNVLHQVLHPICERLGIKRGSFHSFRHGRVSHLQAQSIPAEFIRTQLGHSTLQMTARYSHFSDAFAREQVERAAVN